MTALHKRLASVAERIAAINTEAAGRDLIPPQRSQLASVTTEIVGMADEIRSAGVSQQVAGHLDTLLESLSDGDVRKADTYAKEVARLVNTEARIAEVDAIRGQFGSLFIKDDSMEHIRTSGPGSIAALWPEYRKQGFAAMDVDLSPSFYETRALGSSGGSAVATTFADQVVVYARDVTPMLNPAAVTVSTSRSGAPFKVPRLTADPSFASTATAEAAQLTEADATISAVELTPYKYGGIQIWSAELDTDEIIEIEPLLAKSAGRAIAVGVGGFLTTGTGTGQPGGIVTQATIAGTATKSFGGTASTFWDYGDLVTLFMSVPAESRVSGNWMMPSDAIAKALSFRDDNGNRVVLDGLTGGRLSLLGRPIFENPDMAAVASASASVIFGDTHAYWVRQVVPLRAELSRDYRFNTDEVSLKTVARIDGALVDVGAVKKLISANT